MSRVVTNASAVSPTLHQTMIGSAAGRLDEPGAHQAHQDERDRRGALHERAEEYADQGRQHAGVDRPPHQRAEARAGELAERHPDQLDAEEEEAEARERACSGLRRACGGGVPIPRSALACEGTCARRRPVLSCGMPRLVGSRLMLAAAMLNAASGTGRDEALARPFRRLTRPSGVVDYWPRFSPDGKTVLFSRCEISSGCGGASTSGYWTLWTVPRAGGKSREFLALRDVSATRSNWLLKPSPTQQPIAFTGVERRGSNRAGLWLANADGSGAVEVTLPASVGPPSYPSWFPDGASVAVAGMAPGDPGPHLTQIAIDTGRPILRLTLPTVIWTGEPARGSRRHRTRGRRTAPDHRTAIRRRAQPDLDPGRGRSHDSGPGAASARRVAVRVRRTGHRTTGSSRSSRTAGA